MFTEEELNTIRWIMDRYEHDGKLGKSMRQRMFEIREKVDKHFDEQMRGSGHETV